MGNSVHAHTGTHKLSKATLSLKKKKWNTVRASKKSIAWQASKAGVWLRSFFTWQQTVRKNCAFLLISFVRYAYIIYRCCLRIHWLCCIGYIVTCTSCGCLYAHINTSIFVICYFFIKSIAIERLFALLSFRPSITTVPHHYHFFPPPPSPHINTKTHRAAQLSLFPISMFKPCLSLYHCLHALHANLWMFVQ